MNVVTEGIHRVYLRQAYMHAQARSQCKQTQSAALIVFPSSGVIAADSTRSACISEPTIEHPERAVIYKCASKGLTTLNTTMYVPFGTCIECAKAIVMSGVKRVVFHKNIMDQVPERWRGRFDSGISLLSKAGIELLAYDGKVLNDGEFTILLDGRTLEP